MMHRNRNRHSAVGTASGGANPGAFGDSVSYSELPSAIKTLTDPGKTLQNLLMRCNFRDERQRNAFIVLFWWAIDNAGDDTKSPVLEVVDMLHDWAAASDSIKAERTQKVVESIIGQHRPSGLRRAFGFKRKEQIAEE
jgi:hypothetical protein